jgi:hypothetical protein
MAPGLFLAPNNPNNNNPNLIQICTKNLHRAALAAVLALLAPRWSQRPAAGGCAFSSTTQPRNTGCCFFLRQAASPASGKFGKGLIRPTPRRRRMRWMRSRSRGMHQPTTAPSSAANPRMQRCTNYHARYHGPWCVVTCNERDTRQRQRDSQSPQASGLVAPRTSRLHLAAAALIPANLAASSQQPAASSQQGWVARGPGRALRV